MAQWRKYLLANSCNGRDACSIPGWGRSPEEGNSNPLQYPGLENSWSKESGRLQSMGLQRVRHDRAQQQQRWLNGKESACVKETQEMGGTGDEGLIPGSGRSPGVSMATHSSIFSWKIPWAQEADGLQAMGFQRAGHD